MGVDFLTVHGRTRLQKSTEPVDFEAYDTKNCTGPPCWYLQSRRGNAAKVANQSWLHAQKAWPVPTLSSPKNF